MVATYSYDANVIRERASFQALFHVEKNYTKEFIFVLIYIC